MQNRTKNNNGFTLVELAIALMVIGLLIGGVLKGQELIDNARVTATIRDMKDYDSATMIFRSTYNALPGDIRNPSRRIANCENFCAQSGNNDGKIGTLIGNADMQHEYYNFFPHLTKAGILKAPPGGVQGEMDALDPYMNLPGQMTLLGNIDNDQDIDIILATLFDENSTPEMLNNLATSSGLSIGDSGGNRNVNMPTDSEFYTTFFPALPIDGVGINAQQETYRLNSGIVHVYRLQGMPARYADQIDIKLDDSFAGSGDIYGEIGSRIADQDMTPEGGGGGNLRGLQTGGRIGAETQQSYSDISVDTHTVYIRSKF